MSTTTQEKTGPSATVDLNGLKRFLDERKLGDTSALRSENISFGHSNEVHLVHFDGKSWALRRPPRGPLLPTAHDMLREYRVIEALQGTAVPVPRVYAVCDDPSYVGAHVFLANNAAVTRDVPPYLMVAGTPAEPKGINAEGLKRRGFSAGQIANIKQAYRILYRSQLKIGEASERLAMLAREAPEVQPFVDFLPRITRSLVR